MENVYRQSKLKAACGAATTVLEAVIIPAIDGGHPMLKVDSIYTIYEKVFTILK